MKCFPVLLLLLVETASAHGEVNLALGGEATQISTYDHLGLASHAIDGNRDANYMHSSCTHSNAIRKSWWRLDLRDTYFITSINITNRGDCCAWRLQGAQVRVGNSLQNNGNDNPTVATIEQTSLGKTHTFTLPEQTMGRYVNVFLPGGISEQYLTLCEVEVYGYQEEKENVALRGEATQIDTWDENGAASNAINGNRDSVYSHKSCSHTRTTTDPWWKLDLRRVYVINSISITNRRDCCPQRLDGAEIRIGHSLDNEGNNNPVAATVGHIPAGGSQTFKFPEKEGRYVNVFLPGRDKYLTLCEVEVHGYELDTGESPDAHENEGESG